MTSTEIRQSFLDFFCEKKHTIVPSSSLLPDAPNLLFTNAGMNQFVPIFLGQRKPSWNPARVADTQKCIRVGGKHNDLEDVGFDTYHHTFFEMLGNWSFDDYFKKEAIEWAWELLVERWKFPPQRLYATVYQPGPGEPSEFDQEAYDHWAHLFREADLDPKVHVLSSGKADNFWMMGDTGPCGPCSEVHIDLTPDGDTRGELVNKGDPRCIEIWNLVFIQFNANPDGSFTPLPQRHVDTGMGFERAVAIIQGTTNLTDFSGTTSNYETDVFRPIFDELEKLSGKKYASTLPTPGSDEQGTQEKIDVAFRVIADHIRALSFAIADGVIPSNESRGYVLRRILRRAVRYGRSLDFHQPFLFKLAHVVSDAMGDVFPELRDREKRIMDLIQREEEVFNRTLDNGIEFFEQITSLLQRFHSAAQRSKPLIERIRLADELSVDTPTIPGPYANVIEDAKQLYQNLRPLKSPLWSRLSLNAANLAIIYAEHLADSLEGIVDHELPGTIMVEQLEDMTHKIDVISAGIDFGLTRHKELPGTAAFLLYDEQGFPLDLTQLMARERGLTVDVTGFDELMQKQRARARGARRRQIVEVSQYEPKDSTKFVGYRRLNAKANVLDVIDIDQKVGIVLDKTPFYAQMGGQVGDTGTIKQNVQEWSIVDTQKKNDGWLHLVEVRSAHPNTNVFLDANARLPELGSQVVAAVDANRRLATQRHHTATHLLHWALHEIVGRDAVQKGSYVGPDKLTFDFASAPLSKEQVHDVEKLINQRILEDCQVSWTEVPYAEIRNNPDILQFFADKYAEVVRVVQIGGKSRGLNGYSMELCGGTHVGRTGEIGLFRIVHESAISTGVRRVEAVAGLKAYEDVRAITESYDRLATILKAQTTDLEKRVASLLHEKKELEKAQTSSIQREGAIYVKEHCQPVLYGTVPTWVDVLPLRERGVLLLQNVLDALKTQRFNGVAVLAGVDSNNTVQLAAYVSADLTTRIHAGRIIETIAPIVGGKGGGRAESARGAGKLVDKMDRALAKARELLS